MLLFMPALPLTHPPIAEEASGRGRSPEDKLSLKFDGQTPLDPKLSFSSFTTTCIDSRIVGVKINSKNLDFNIIRLRAQKSAKLVFHKQRIQYALALAQEVGKMRSKRFGFSMF